MSSTNAHALTICTQSGASGANWKGGHIKKTYDRVVKMGNFVSEYLKFEYGILDFNNWFENKKKLIYSS